MLSRAFSQSSCKSEARIFYQPEPVRDALVALPRGCTLLLEELVRCSGRHGYTWALQDRLAETLRSTTRTIRRWEAALVKAGLLTTARVSLYCRRLDGGVRRLAIPHRWAAGRWILPVDLSEPRRGLRLEGGGWALVGWLRDIKTGLEGGVRAALRFLRSGMSGKGKGGNMEKRKPEPDGVARPCGHRHAWACRASGCHGLRPARALELPASYKPLPEPAGFTGPGNLDQRRLAMLKQLIEATENPLERSNLERTARRTGHRIS